MTQTQSRPLVHPTTTPHPAGPDSAVARAMAQRPERASMIDAYFRHVPTEDQPKTPEDVLAIIDGHWRVGRHRRQGEVRMRVFNPAPSGGEGTGWTDTKTVIDIVTDDMPSLVDSVIGALTAQNLIVHRVLHPILIACRDADGDLVAVVDESAPAEEEAFSLRESWMHILIDRLSDAERAESIVDAVRHALESVRAVVGDSGALTAAVATAAGDLRGTFSPRSAQEVAEAADFLYWLISGHMTFLGYRRYDLSSDRSGLAPVRGSGLGILREWVAGPDGDDLIGQSPTGEPHHLLLTQASVRSALTRDVPPFEVRVRMLGPDGVITREHRILGVFTARALNAEITTTPVLRLTVQAVLSTLGAEQVEDRTSGG
jgi:glutamate dehydrogenase